MNCDYNVNFNASPIYLVFDITLFYDDVKGILNQWYKNKRKGNRTKKQSNEEIKQITDIKNAEIAVKSKKQAQKQLQVPKKGNLKKPHGVKKNANG